MDKRFQYFKTEYYKTKDPIPTGAISLSIEFEFDVKRDNSILQISVNVWMKYKEIDKSKEFPILKATSIYRTSYLPEISIYQLYSLLVNAIDRLKNYSPLSDEEGFGILVRRAPHPSMDQVQSILQSQIHTIYFSSN